MTNKKFGIIVMDLSLFDFGPKPPCGYIKAKHIRSESRERERDSENEKLVKEAPETDLQAQKQFHYAEPVLPLCTK